MKKIVRVIVLAASIITTIYLIRFLGSPVNYTNCIVSESQADELMASRQETINLLDSLAFNEEVLVFDISSGTFYYSLIENDSKAFAPNIKIKGNKDNVRIVFLEKEITEDLIRENQTITVLAYTNELYCKYNLKCTTLPIMSINCTEDISTDSVSMTMTLFDNSEWTASRFISSEGNIHVRGRTVQTYPKKGYRFSLIQESFGGNIRPNHVSLLGMRQDDDWLLYAAYNDHEKIRNVFSSNLWKYTCATDNEPGMDIGMEYRYLELFVNGEYWGLYALGYPVDEKQLSVKSSEFSVMKHGIYGETLQFDSKGSVIGYTSVNPDLTDYELSRLIDYYCNLYINADNNEKLFSGIDLDNVIDFYLFINLVQGVDNVGMIKNYYILLQDMPEGIKAFYAPWDLDLTWGNCYSFYDISADYNCVIENGYISQLMVNRDELILNKIINKYKELRKTGWSEDNINVLLDEYEKDIYGSGAYLRDMERWPDGNYSNASEGLSIFRNYVMERLQEADLYYERLENIYFENENIFIRRSALYKDFLECRFIVEINNRDLLKDPDYKDFLEYIGIDISSITEDIHFILANPAKGEFEYLSSLYMGESERETLIGTLSFERVREGNYMVSLDYVNRYEISMFYEPEIKMSIVKDNIRHADYFNFSKGYDIMEQVQKDVPAQLQVYLKALSETNYYSVIEINKPDIWQNSDYIGVFKALGISGANIHNTTDFIIWNGPEKKAVILDDFHLSGSTYESELCTFSVFWNESEEYGVYLDNHDCYISSDENNRYVDVRIVLLDPETYDVVDMQTYLCEY